MEQQNKILKLLFLIAFLALAGVSCWATAESLHMLLDTWPIVFCWVVTIAFFIIASLGTKLIADSLNQNVYVEKRTAKLIAGVVITFIFWLVCSMPTNTHTFFYKLKIGDVVTTDISNTKSYLSQLVNRDVTDSAFFNDIKNPVDKLSLEMNNEFNGLGISRKKGNGQYVMECMRKINSILSSNIPIDPRFNVYDISILNRYNTDIANALENVKRTKYQTQDGELASIMQDDLDAMSNAIQDMVNIGAIDEDLIKQTEGVLQRAYALIQSNKKFVKFKNIDDEKIYTAENLVTRTKRLRSVFDVWVDFINGRYQDSVLFAFWIVISILVDVAAFIFFDLVFKKEEY